MDNVVDYVINNGKKDPREYTNMIRKNKTIYQQKVMEKI